jgi:hypothetical protein
MTFQKDVTGVLQTATRDAAIITAAEVGAGIVKSHDSIVKRFQELRDEVLLPPLQAAVEADNAMFKAEEAAAPAKKSYPAKKSGSTGGGDIDDPGSVAFKGKGKFAGLTVAEVFALTADEAKEGYAYTDKEGNAKPGSAYIEWCAGNEKNPFMQKVATKFLELKRASSDA